MPNLEQSDLHQKAVLWSLDSPDDYGKPRVSAATEIDVRWEKTRSEVTDEQNNTVIIDAVAVVDREITVGSLMWLGQEDDLPTPVTDLRQVKYYKEIPDVKNRSSRRIVGLKKYNDSLPTVV